MQLHIVLFEPAIILNVGNIARTCLAFNAMLHLIRPYGFIFDRAKLKRSSTNHIDLIQLNQYDNWNEFIKLNSENAKYFFYSRWGNLAPNDINIKTLVNENPDINLYLVFGNEQTGIPFEILNQYPNQIIRIPMNQNLICLNIANSVSIACYEVLRQLKYHGLYKEGK